MARGSAQFGGTPAEVAAQIRRALKGGGSAEHATGVKCFFKDEVKSQGWYTADLRRAVHRRRELLREQQLFLRAAGEEFVGDPHQKIEIVPYSCSKKWTRSSATARFRMFESWLDRISSWADHDGLVDYLISPMVAAKAGAGQRRIPLGQVAESLASARRLRGADSRGTGNKVLPQNRKAVRLTSRR